VATTAQKLHALVSTGAFLESLFFRLNEVCLTVPALSARDGDLYLLAVHILRQLTPPGSTMGRRSLTPRAWKLLSAYPFPGNVAELDAALRSAVAAAGDGDLDAEHLPATVRG
jgi:DNA-binding NtrC family response regulator